MKTYNCYIYHPDKQGFEQYEFLQKVETDNPRAEAEKIYAELLDKQPKGVHSLEIPLTINKIGFSSIHCAFNGGGTSDEIVLAESIL